SGLGVILAAQAGAHAKFSEDAVFGHGISFGFLRLCVEIQGFDQRIIRHS
ncbi:MAG: hypothetical protein ACI9TA_002092, partial [Reinekea sp.]